MQSRRDVLTGVGLGLEDFKTDGKVGFLSVYVEDAVDGNQYDSIRDLTARFCLLV